MKRAVIILGAGLKKNKNGKWASTDLSGKDNKFGAPGGKLRVVAGSYLFRNNPGQIIIASGGKGWDIKVKNRRPYLSEIIKRDLIKLGVPAKNIICEKKSNTTYQQLKELIKIIKKNNIKKIVIISNVYHLPRIKAIIKADYKLKNYFKLINTKFISAEKIVLQYERKKWQDIIKKAYNSKEMKGRIKKEQKGIRDLKLGKYKLK